MFEEPFFARKKIDLDKLQSYGFVEAPDGYRYTVDVMGGQLRLEVFIDRGGAVSTHMTDPAAGEEYVLYKIEGAEGAFLGRARTACEEALADIAQKCCEPDVFRRPQTLELIRYVAEQFGDEPEFLWKKFPDYAVWRRRDSQKWYGVIGTVSRRKLGQDSDEIVEVLDLRLAPEQMAHTVDRTKFFPGWHMNKKHWYTAILDGAVPAEELCRRIGDSYDLAGK